MCRDASRRVVLGLGGSGSGDGACTTTGSACLGGGGGVLCKLCALSGAFLATGSSTMTIFFFLGALSGAPFGLPRFLGAGSTCGFSETASSFSGIVSFCLRHCLSCLRHFTITQHFFNQSKEQN